MPVKNSSTTTNRFSVEMNFLTMTKMENRGIKTIEKD